MPLTYPEFSYKSNSTHTLPIFFMHFGKQTLDNLSTQVQNWYSDFLPKITVQRDRDCVDNLGVKIQDIWALNPCQEPDILKRNGTPEGSNKEIFTDAQIMLV